MPSKRKKYSPSHYFKYRNNLSPFYQNEIKQPIDKDKNADEKANKSNKIIKWINAHYANIASIIINGILAWFTYGLLRETVLQRQLTQKSADAAVKAADEAKRANDHNIHKDSVESNEQHIRDQVSKTKDSITIALAQQSLKNSKNLFDIDRKGFLQILLTNDTIIQKSPKAGDFMAIPVNIRNLGNYPVHILKSGRSILVSDKLPSEKIKMENVSLDVSKEYPMMPFIKTKPFTKGQVDSLNAGKSFIFIRGSYIYQGASNKNRRFDYTIKIENMKINGRPWFVYKIEKSKNFDL
jgi:hypothetical protein